MRVNEGLLISALAWATAGALAGSAYSQQVKLQADLDPIQKECFADDESYTLHLSVSLRITNRSPQKVCVSKHPKIVHLLIAKDAERMVSGDYEMDIRPDPVISSPAAPEAGGSPEAADTCTPLRLNERILLHETTPPIFVRLSSSGSKSLLPAGQHVMAVEVEGIRSVPSVQPHRGVVGEDITLKSNILTFSVRDRHSAPPACQDFAESSEGAAHERINP